MIYCNLQECNIQSDTTRTLHHTTLITLTTLGAAYMKEKTKARLFHKKPNKKSAVWCSVRVV